MKKTLASSEASREGDIAARRLRLRDDLQSAQPVNGRGWHALTDRERMRADARGAILESFQQFRSGFDGGQVAAEYAFCSAYNEHRIDAGEMVRQTYARLSRGTLVRWRRLIARGVARLAPRYGNRRGAGKIDSQEDLARFCKAMLTDYPDVQPRQLLNAINARYASRDDIELPSIGGVRRWLSAWRQDNADLLLAIAHPDGWKSRRLAAFGSASESIVRPNQLWELDATPGDIEFCDEDGRPIARCAVTGVTDVFSGRMILMVVPTNRATAVAALLRRAIVEWGVPEKVKIDNGKEYVGHHTMRVLMSLGVGYDLCRPFCGWEKPHMERGFRTYQHDLVELLPAFAGHDVAGKQRIRNRTAFSDQIMRQNGVCRVRMTREQFQSFTDRWLAVYHDTPHRGERMQGQSPNQRVAGWRGHARRIENLRALDLLLAEAPDNHGRRVVHKKGIRLKWPHEPHHHWYIAPELGPHIGSQVTVLYDPAGDMGRVYVFGEHDFTCIAECAELSGISRRQYAAEARRRQTAAINEQRRELRRAAAQANLGGIAAEILEHKSSRLENVAHFPATSGKYTSDGLSAAERACEQSDAADAPCRAPAPSPETTQRLAAEAEAEQRPHETAEQRFARYLDLCRRDAGGIDQVSRKWMQVYAGTSECRGRLLLLDDDELDRLHTG